MKDVAVIRIDCTNNTVSAETENQGSEPHFGGHFVMETPKSLLISECLRPTLIELMNLPIPELKRRAMIAMGVRPS